MPLCYCFAKMSCLSRVSIHMIAKKIDRLIPAPTSSFVVSISAANPIGMAIIAATAEEIDKFFPMVLSILITIKTIAYY